MCCGRGDGGMQYLAIGPFIYGIHALCSVWCLKYIFVSSVQRAACGTMAVMELYMHEATFS